MLYYYDIIIILLMGYNLSLLLENFNIVSINSALGYYNSIPIIDINLSLCLIFKPITYYGILLWLPAIFKLSKLNANNLQLYLHLFYFAHYYTINLYVSILYLILYGVPTYYARIHYINSRHTLHTGIVISILAISIQLLFRQNIVGDFKSIVESITNTIIYTNYYTILSLVKKITGIFI